MRNRVWLLSTILILGWLPATVTGETGDPDDDGFIRHWLVLAPIPLESGQSGAEAVTKAGLKDEGKITPKEGETVAIQGGKCTWKKYVAQDNYLDFNEFLGQESEDCVAYAVSYLWSDAAVPNLKLKMGSDDQAKVYLNGVELLMCEQPRALTKDQDTAENVTLHKGRNVLVFKVVNGKLDFSGSIRFMDGAGKVFRDYKVSVHPGK